MIKLPKLVKDDVIYSFKFNRKRRLCDKCGTMFKPKSANSRYCSDRCRDLVAKERNEVSKSKAKKRRAKNVTD